MIEVMVVLLIIALMTSMIVISIRSNADRDAKLEAERFMAVVNQVRDESILVGDTFLLTLDEKAKEYSFAKARVAAEQDDDSALLLRPRKIKDSVKVRWKTYAQLENEEPDVPRVIISSLGEITPFEMRFGGDDYDFLVFVNDEGQLQQKKRTSGFF